ncbi:uncharacterized protein LOC119168118 [Rhipicephalus microplus]|uniref:uncharacterized protein LOC119168118 n=1 Tax=Rhipicephalus microplus TaxID=6941 RepID=UPI003F6C96A7
MAKQLLASLLLATSSVALECKLECIPIKQCNIKAFVDTPYRIWTYSTSDSRQFKCKVDIRQFVTTTAIFFNEWYKMGTEKIYAAFKGQYNEKKKACMLVSNKDTTQLQCMMYYSRRGGCAVVEVKTHKGETYFDLRVQEPYLRKGPSSKCVQKFAKWAPQGREIYDVSCKGILSRNKIFV